MHKDLEIVPAILPKTFSELSEKLEKLKGVASLVQIDVTDGKFAGEPSWPIYKDDENFKAIVREEMGMPFWEEFEFEFDLMVEDPFSLIPDFIKAGASKIVLHAKTINLDNDKILLDQLRTEGVVSVGIAFEDDAEEEFIKELLPYADFVQFMGITKIGFQGEPFNPNILNHIRFMKQEIPDMQIAVDGGMTLDTAPQAIDAGASKIVVGHAILESANPMEAMREFEALV